MALNYRRAGGIGVIIDSHPFYRKDTPAANPRCKCLQLRRPIHDDGSVKRWYYIVLGGVLLTGSVYIYLHRVDLGLVSPPVADGESTYSAGSSGSGVSAQPARIVWQKVDRSPDGFKIEMPADSKEMQIPAYNGTGGAEQVDMLYAYPDAETSYSLAWADNPPVARASNMAVDKTLDTARDDALARTQSTMVSESKNSRHGYPARDFVGRNAGGGIFNARLVLVGPRLYMMIAAFPSDTARRPQDVARFFDSFSAVNGNRSN